jgi:hypothetical protein
MASHPRSTEPRIPNFAKDLLKSSDPTEQKTDERKRLEALAKKLGVPLTTSYWNNDQDEGKERTDIDLICRSFDAVSQLQKRVAQGKELEDALHTLACHFYPMFRTWNP